MQIQNCDIVLFFVIFKDNRCCDLHIFFGQVSKSNYQKGESQILTETTPKNPLT